MLLVIHNLPSKTNVSDVKFMIKSKCGIENVIVDNLISEGNGKKVTVGLADDGDAAIFVRKINGLYIDNQQLYVEDIRNKQANEQPYSKSLKTNNQRYSNNYGYQTTQFDEGYIPQLQLPVAQNTSQTSYVDVQQVWAQHVPQSFGNYYAQEMGEINLFNNNSQQPYDTGFQFNQSSVPGTTNSSQYFPSSTDASVRNNSRWDRNTGSDNPTQVDSNKYDPSEIFEEYEHNRDSYDGKYTDYRPQRNNISTNDSMYSNRRERSSRRGPSPKRQKFENNNYESNQFHINNRSRINQIKNAPANKRSGNRDTLPRRSPRGLNNQQFGSPRQSKNFVASNKANKSFDAPRSTEGRNAMAPRPSTSNFSRPENFNPWQNDAYIPRPEISQATKSRSRQSTNSNVARPVKKYEVANYNSSSKRPNDRKNNGNATAPKNISTKPRNDEMTSLMNKDQTWRGQVSSQIAKTIIRNQKIPSEINIPRLTNQLKFCIRSRIDILLGDRFAVPPPEINTLYMNKFPTKEWPSFFEAVLESFKNSGPDNWKPKGDTDTNTLKKNSAFSVPDSRGQIKNDKQTEAPRAPNLDLLSKAAVGTVPKYPNADKNIYKVQKKLTTLEYLGDLDYHLEPTLQKALDEELNMLVDEFKKGCEEPNDETEMVICQNIHDKASENFKQIISLHLKKRLLNICTGLVVRIFGTPKKPALMEFLKDYGVVSLKKSDMKKMSIAHIDGYKNFDRLCALERTEIDGILVSFKPLNLIGPPNKKLKKDVNDLLMSNVEKIKLDNISKPNETIEETSKDNIKDSLIKEGDTIALKQQVTTIVETQVHTSIETDTVKEDNVESNNETTDLCLEEMTEIDSWGGNDEVSEKNDKTQNKKESSHVICGNGETLSGELNKTQEEKEMTQTSDVNYEAASGNLNEKKLPQVDEVVENIETKRTVGSVEISKVEKNHKNKVEKSDEFGKIENCTGEEEEEDVCDSIFMDDDDLEDY